MVCGGEGAVYEHVIDQYDWSALNESELSQHKDRGGITQYM